MAQKSTWRLSLSLYVAAMLRKNPELNSIQIKRQLKKRGINAEIDEIHLLVKSWHKKEKNIKILLQFRRNGGK